MSATTREALCDAALTLFAEQGIESTATREIAEKAGVAEGTLYRHFESKDELVQCLFDDSARRFYEVLQQTIADDPPPRDRLQALVRGVFAFAEADPTAFTYLLSVHHTGILEERENPPPPMRLFVDTLTEGTEQGSFRSLSPVLATGWIVAMAQRAVVFLSSPLMTDSREAVIQETIQAALRLVDATDPQ
jgi:AcrR family transcriptional regulator